MILIILYSEERSPTCFSSEVNVRLPITGGSEHSGIREDECAKFCLFAAFVKHY